MRTKSVLLVYCLITWFFSACTKEKAFCETHKPLTKIGWLKPYLKPSIHCKIYKASYNGIDGFLIYSCINENCSPRIGEFKSCQNETICTFGGIDNQSCINFNSNNNYYELIYSN
jgi:hypothetical protein